ncbi:TrbI/VirB10 family protein [Pseudomonas sp. RW10S2]|uniref:TrbI/VirB10 family protein n=1 Tax=Pseudomonas sp. RW10S2 TaxID=459637 RepID=UPI0016467572|nr:TrbI/VirB10 family protein [Pseudomonas sp. RW10S2]MBC3466857.1 TrbI/VirB10 family protein [Pseudomonas sp. RW10S2]
MSAEETASSADAPVAPKMAPEAVALRAQPPAVMRLNRRTLAWLCGALASAVLGAALWSLQPHRHNGNDATELYNVDRVPRAGELDQLPADYTKVSPKPADVPPLGPPLPGDLGPPMLNTPVAARYTAPGDGGGAGDRDARQKEADAAAGSAVFFRTGQPGAGTPEQGVAGSGSTTAPSTATLADLDALAWAMPPTMAGAAPADPTAVQNRQDQKEAFLTRAKPEIRNSANLQMPASPYQVMAGTVIAAALVTGIKSDVPGDVIASVTEPVYDTATGHTLLIPQGSRLLGKYNSQVSYGQSRAQVVWNRIILPDTSSITLDNLAGTDPAGYAGLEDGVDWHWRRLVAGAALTSVLGVGAELAAPENRNGDRILLAGRDSLQDSVNQAGQELTRRNLNLQPTLTERPGLPVRIIVRSDLVLRPYRPLFVDGGTTP